MIYSIKHLSVDVDHTLIHLEIERKLRYTHTAFDHPSKFPCRRVDLSSQKQNIRALDRYHQLWCWSINDYRQSRLIKTLSIYQIVADCTHLWPLVAKECTPLYTNSLAHAKPNVFRCCEQDFKGLYLIYSCQHVGIKYCTYFVLARL